MDAAARSLRSQSRSREVSALLRLGVPLALVQGGQALMGLVDTAVMGRVSAVGQAGAGLGNGLFFMVSVVGIGTLLGVDPMIAQALGAGDPRRARGWLWQGTWTALGAAAVLAGVLWMIPAVLAPLGVPAEQAVVAGDFMRWRAPGVFPLLVFGTSRAYLQANHRTRELVVLALAANVLNLGLDLLLVFGGTGLPGWAGPLRWIPAMGAGGAALASTLCVTAEMLFVVWVVSRVRVVGEPLPIRPSWPQIRSLLGVGVPIGLHLLVEGGFFTAAALLASRLGAEAEAAHQVALNFGSLTFTLSAGLGTAGAVRVGYAVGAKDTPGARRAGITALVMGAIFMGTCGLVFAAFREPLARALSFEPGVQHLVGSLLLVAAAFQVSDGLQCVGAGVLRGAGVSRFTFWANLVGHYAVGLPAVLAFGFCLHGGVVGIWWGLSVGLTAVAAALVWKFLRVSSKEIVALEP